MPEPEPEQMSIDMDDTEHLPGAVPASPEAAHAARWEFYRGFRVRQGEQSVCIPDQLIHCFGHHLDRTCVCGRVKAVGA